MSIIVLVVEVTSLHRVCRDVAIFFDPTSRIFLFHSFGESIRRFLEELLLLLVVRRLI